MSTKPPRPFVLINMAMTADGKIATANRRINTFGSQRDGQHLYELRATADAVMSGARTLDTNPYLLGNGGERFRRLRRKNGLGDYALRIIVSGSASIDPAAAIFKQRFAPIILLTTQSAAKARIKRLAPLVDDLGQFGEQELDIRAALRWLQTKWSVKHLLCEGGADLNGLLFRADVVDEINLTVCPYVFGGRTAPTIAGGNGLQHLGEARKFGLSSAKRAGDELFAVFRRK